MNNLIQQGYHKAVRKKIVFLWILLVTLIVSLMLDLCSGPGDFSIYQVITTLVSPDAVSPQLELITWQIRLPIALMAITVGAMLSLAGAQMQTILNNPLADPFTLGISSAASFGAAIPIVYSVTLFEVKGLVGLESTVSAFLFSILTTFLLYFLTRVKNASSETMILVGIALLFTFNALLSLLQYTATDAQISEIVFWMMGSLTRTSWQGWWICVVLFALVTPLFLLRTWQLTALRMGDDKAQSMGINVERLRIEILIGVSLLAATAVSFVGTIAFIGLVGPHIARMLVGEDQRFFMPLSVLTGALLMSMTSVLSKSITPGVVYPAGIITSLIGIPFFLSLVLKTKNRGW